MYLDLLKKELNKGIDNFNENHINLFANFLSENKQHNIHITGIGKSKNFANHMSDILKSLSYKSFFFDIIDGLHGDIGSIKDNDIFIIISRSGNTNEMINPLIYLKKKNIKIVGIFCKDNSVLKEHCTNTIILPEVKEMDCNLNMVPSTSLIVYNIFLSILIRHLFDVDKIDLEKYSINHPAGDIGRRAFIELKDKIKKNNEILTININDEDFIHSKIFNIMKKMDKIKIGICCFINNDNSLYGIITNGMLISELSKRQEINLDSIINKNPNIITNHINTRISELNLKIKHRYFPVIQNNKLYGIYENL